jgi:hypothetical protein
MQVKKCTKKGKAKEAQSRQEEESNETTADGMSSIGYNSDDDSNGSGNSGIRPKKTPAALKQGGKTRAGRGSASDPQSLYARVLHLHFWSKILIYYQNTSGGKLF